MGYANSYFDAGYSLKSHEITTWDYRLWATDKASSACECASICRHALNIPNRTGAYVEAGAKARDKRALRQLCYLAECTARDWAAFGEIDLAPLVISVTNEHHRRIGAQLLVPEYIDSLTEAAEHDRREVCTRLIQSGRQTAANQAANLLSRELDGLLRVRATLL